MIYVPTRVLDKSNKYKDLQRHELVLRIPKKSCVGVTMLILSAFRSIKPPRYIRTFISSRVHIKGETTRLTWQQTQVQFVATVIRRGFVIKHSLNSSMPLVCYNHRQKGKVRLLDCQIISRLGAFTWSGLGSIRRSSKIAGRNIN